MGVTRVVLHVFIPVAENRQRETTQRTMLTSFDLQLVVYCVCEFLICTNVQSELNTLNLLFCFVFYFWGKLS